MFAGVHLNFPRYGNAPVRPFIPGTDDDRYTLGCGWISEFDVCASGQTTDPHEAAGLYEAYPGACDEPPTNPQPTFAPTMMPTAALASVIRDAPELRCGDSVRGTTVGGTNYFGFAESVDVIYQLELDQPQTVTVTTCGSVYGERNEIDTVLMVYDAAGLTPDTVAIARNDDHANIVGNHCIWDRDNLASAVQVTLQPGVYAIVVEAYAYGAGAFNLTIDCLEGRYVNFNQGDGPWAFRQANYGNSYVRTAHECYLGGQGTGIVAGERLLWRIMPVFNGWHAVVVAHHDSGGGAEGCNCKVLSATTDFRGPDPDFSHANSNNMLFRIYRDPSNPDRYAFLSRLDGFGYLASRNVGEQDITLSYVWTFEQFPTPASCGVQQGGPFHGASLELTSSTCHVAHQAVSSLWCHLPTCETSADLGTRTPPLTLNQFDAGASTHQTECGGGRRFSRQTEDLQDDLDPSSGSGDGEVPTGSRTGDAAEVMVHVTLQPGDTLVISFTNDHHNQNAGMHQLAWGGECPGNHVVACSQDDDEVMRWTNDQATAQTVWYVVDGDGW